MTGRSSAVGTVRQHLASAAVVPGVMFVDALTKRWVDHDLAPDERVALLGNVVRVRLQHHTAPAFEVFADSGRWLNVVAGLALVGVAIGVFDPRSAFNAPRAGWFVGLMLGGGLANLFNRLPDGRVTDFLDLGVGAARWPSFNVADGCVALGFAALLVVRLGEMLPRLAVARRAADRHRA